MPLRITYNDAWESVPLSSVDDVLAFFERRLQPSHPLRAYRLFPIAKCWRKQKYLIEEENPTDNLWVLDFERKRRVRGKTYFYFRHLESQSDLDDMLKHDYDEWVQYMKDAGTWHGQ